MDLPPPCIFADTKVDFGPGFETYNLRLQLPVHARGWKISHWTRGCRGFVLVKHHDDHLVRINSMSSKG